MSGRSVYGLGRAYADWTGWFQQCYISWWNLDDADMIVDIEAANGILNFGNFSAVKWQHAAATVAKNVSVIAAAEDIVPAFWADKMTVSFPSVPWGIPGIVLLVIGLSLWIFELGWACALLYNSIEKFRGLRSGLRKADLWLTFDLLRMCGGWCWLV